MGSWGTGNLDSDAGMDTLGVLKKQLVNIVSETFTYESNDRIFSGYGESRIMANIDILIVLSQHYNSPVDLKKTTVDWWERKYLEAYDRIVFGDVPWNQSSDTFAIDRRKVIEETFNKFKNSVSDF